MANAKKTEVPRRLEPTKDVRRQLFLRSGNLCAFPGCARPIMNAKGICVGLICHIEAAEPKGERFNLLQTNEQRRAYANLLLLCHDHHVETDDVAKFPVARMQEIKANHERKVGHFIEHFRLLVADLTAADVMQPAKSLARFDPSLASSLNLTELKQTVEVVNDLLTRLHRLPRPVREMLVLVAERAKPSGRIGLSCSYVSMHELRMHCGLEHETLSQLLQVLDDNGFIVEAGPDDYGHPRLALRHLDGWDIWSGFRTFQAESGVTLHDLIVELNFSHLD